MATIVDNTNTEYLDIVKSVNLEISLKKKNSVTICDDRC